MAQFAWVGVVLSNQMHSHFPIWFSPVSSAPEAFFVPRLTSNCFC